MRDPKLEPSPKDAILRAIQRFSLEQSAEESVNVNPELENAGGQICASCGIANRKGNNFCASCGATLLKSPRQADAAPPGPVAGSEPPGDHHYHHHYHHHYFSEGMETGGSGGAAAREVVRARAPQSGPSLSRAEAALRKTTQDWAVACNTKQLDDLVELYIPDALVQRPNVPPVRGASAIREFFFGLLDAGMSEVELDPLRTELFGDFGYEAGRCKSLVPVAMGKRREERGKYLIVMSRQNNGEWRMVADSWSSDLSLGGTADSQPRANLSLGAPASRPLRKP